MIQNRLFRSLGILFIFWAQAFIVCAQESPGDWYNVNESGGNNLNLYFFWTKHCPHCAAARPFIDQLDTKYPWIKVHAFEITGNSGNIERYMDLAGSIGEEAESVPAFLFCEILVTGYDSDETTGELLDYWLSTCYEKVKQGDTSQPLKDEYRVDSLLPYFGDLKSKDLSLFAFTILLAGMDAFNPCAFFVLMFLLSLLTHVKSRSRMRLIGSVFVFFSGFIYFVFMSAWLNVFVIMDELAVVTIIAGIIAVILALLNIKDYFRFGSGMTTSLSGKSKSRIYERVRHIVNSASLPSMLLSTVILAVAANSYELLCTAGIPMLYTKMLTLHDLKVTDYYLYLMLYNVVYVIPLILIVVLFSHFHASYKMSEWQGRVLKLLSGTMMLVLGLLLIFSPQAIQSIGTALLALLGAIVLSALIVLLSRISKTFHHG